MYLMCDKWDSERRSVCGRDVEKDGERKCTSVCYPFLLWSPLLLSTFACGQVCSCHGSLWNKETDRQGFLLNEGCDESSSLHCHCTQRSLCKQETTEGGRTQKTMSREEQKGEEKKYQAGSEGKERETEKDEESCHHKESDSFLLFWI